MRDWAFVFETENPREEPRRFLLVVRRDDRVIENDAHDAPLPLVCDKNAPECPNRQGPADFEPPIRGFARDGNKR
jgi:hypothetical protein